jgi:predicted TIM-barrel fold metal-dependent hydrolase
MITGFNPTDMYAADHIRRVLLTFPGVFSGIGEFSIHKEFVSSKIAGDVASLRDPALDRILDFAAEAGLVVILHNDIDKPFPKKGTKGYLAEIKDLFRRHRNTRIIWAHCGLGRIIQPMENQAELIAEILGDSSFNHVCFDISWDEVAKYLTSSEKAVEKSAALINKYPDRFLFGTDVVAPGDEEHYLAVYNMYAPLWKKLSPEASRLVRTGNYRRLFDEARTKVRAWEHANGK